MNFYSAEQIEQMEYDFFGLTKKSRERIANRREARQERKLEKIAARGDARAQVAAAGGGIANAAKGLLDGVGNAASQLLGGGAAPAPAQTMDYAPEPKQAGMGNAGLIIMAALVIGAVVFAFIKKKKAA